MSSGFLLDTNVPSELTHPLPDPRVASWVKSNSRLHLSVVSIGELRRGCSLLPLSKRRTQLEQWFEHSLMPLFDGRILPVNQAIAERWGILGAHSKLRGKPLPLADGLIAATALIHNLTVVTRNTKDFADLGVAILNPWEL